jgi:hypothetical protein
MNQLSFPTWDWPVYVPPHRQVKMMRELNHALATAFYDRFEAKQYTEGYRFLLETRNVVCENSYTARELMVNQGGKWVRDSLRLPLDDSSVHWDATFEI